MTTVTKAKLNEANPRTSAQVLAEQKAQAAREIAAAKNKTAPPAAPAPTVPPVVAKPSLPAVPGGRTSVQRYLDEVDPASIVGTMVKFSKEAGYIRADTEEAISDQTIFAFHADQTVIGRIKFNGPGNPTDRMMGLLYDGFEMPDRATLGDDDQSQWEIAWTASRPTHGN
jgi:hypothetical protein